ncbi:MAG: transglycosylase SLT domain-containing protein [Hylemonella sp.]
MHRLLARLAAPPRPLSCSAHGLASWAGVAWLACHLGSGMAQAGLLPPTPAAVLAAEPPALRQLLEQGNALESGNDESGQSTWQAAVHYCKAAGLGSIEGQYRLGMLYAFGQGVPQSRALAAALFSLAAANGHAQASQMLESTQFTSATLPPCVTSAQLPEKVPPVIIAKPQEPAPNSDNIDRLVMELPQNKRWIVPLATQLSSSFELDPKLVLAVIAAESNFEVKARSHKEAQGLMQLIPATAERFNVKNAFDATQNLRGGMRYLRWLLSYYRGNITYALAAYNAGERRVDRHRGVPPIAETREYVKRILGLYGLQRHAFDPQLAEAPEWLTVVGR